MMRQPYTISVALRYLRARASAAFISFISAVSMLGIALAVAVLIVVMAVINGFESELERRILSVSPDAKLSGYDGEGVAPVENWAELRAAALARADVEAAAPYVEGQGMVVADAGLLGVQVRGVDVALEPGVSSLSEQIVDGDFARLADNESIAIGANLAEALDVEAGDELILLLPRARVTIAGIGPTLKVFDIAAIFDVGMQEFDRGLVLVGIDIAQTLYRTGGRATGISLRVDDVYAARDIVYDFGQTMARRYNASYLPEDWSFTHGPIFRSIELTRPMLFIMLSLVVLIAAFNIVSTLMMVVREKRGDIAILRSMGASPRSILNIFVYQGSSIGVLGTLAGLLLGLALVASLGTIVGWIEGWFAIELMSAEVYLIGDLPTEARPAEVMRICALALALAVLATIYPAYRAARQPPAEALRYE